MFSILLSPENLKTPATRAKANHIISICVKRYGHAFSVQTTVSQNLQYYEHLCDPMAELLDLMASEYDYPNLAGEVIRYFIGPGKLKRLQGDWPKGLQRHRQGRAQVLLVVLGATVRVVPKACQQAHGGPGEAS